MEPPSFWWFSNTPEHLSDETLDPMKKTLAFPSTPIDVRRKGVAQWIFLLGWVRLVTRYNKNTHMPQLLQRFRPDRKSVV